MYKIMTPGPVQVPENVRLARSCSTTNADLDPVFFDEYKELCELISNLLHTKNEMKKNLIFKRKGIRIKSFILILYKIYIFVIL